MSQIVSALRRRPAVSSIVAVLLIAAAFVGCATATGVAGPGETAGGSVPANVESAATSDAPAILSVPENLSVSLVDGETARWEQIEDGQEPAILIPPGRRNLVIEWLGEDGESAGEVELTKSFQPGHSYRLLRARTSIFLLPAD